jgi:hypothetical protein
MNSPAGESSDKESPSMANSYLPRQDAQALAWMQHFAGGIAADPARYLLGPADAAAIRDVVDAFGEAMARSSDPATRTRPSVLAKDQARVAAEQLCALYYSLIKPSAAVSDPDKIAIGVRPLNRTRTPIRCPITAPALGIVAATPGRHTLRYRDSLGGGGGKPFGATHLQLFVAVGAAAPAGGPADARWAGQYTRNPITVAFDPADDGRRATYYGRWIARRGDVGPWSAPVGMRIAA